MYGVPELARVSEEVRRRLLTARTAKGHWAGQLSGSALSTATACFALHVVDAQSGPAGAGPHAAQVRAGLGWLCSHQNAGGGWGDTVRSLSNLSATALAWAALTAAPESPDASAAVSGAEQYLVAQAGSLEPAALAGAIAARYGDDRTFSAPILSMLALAGRLGPQSRAWRHVAQLPFELAACPHRLLGLLRLPVVSYALPAMIAIGQARHRHGPSACPLKRLLRNALSERTLGLLRASQPASGGFLEAAPLTGFVTMNLCGAGIDSPPARAVIDAGAAFLSATARPDGSWPIDTNLATWVTTLSVNALAVCHTSSDDWSGKEPRPEGSGHTDRSHVITSSPSRSRLTASPPLVGMAEHERAAIVEWLLARQGQVEHPYTHAAPGGWAWTDLSGGVPDGDDTPGAMLALAALAPHDERATRAAMAGADWLMDLQNSDGGTPTFCRGWGRLPFDRSSPDLTAHALRALRAWLDHMQPSKARRAAASIARGLRFLRRAQQSDGAFLPLWFGNQHTVDEANATYGTARVLPALAEFLQPGNNRQAADIRHMAARAAGWLMANQNADAGWGGRAGTPSSIEETALAIDALAKFVLYQASIKDWSGNEPRPAVSGRTGRNHAITSAPFRPRFTATPRFTRGGAPDTQAIVDALQRGARWLIAATRGGTEFSAAPIGLYFARLWYFEELYPVIFTASALGRLEQLTADNAQTVHE